MSRYLICRTMTARRCRSVDLLVKEAQPGITAYLNGVEPQLEDEAGQIEDVEKELDFALAGVRMLGYVDKVRSRAFFDYKIVGRKASEGDVQYNPQLRLYETQVGRPGALIQIIRGQPKVHVAHADPNPAACAGTLNWAESVIEAIELAKRSECWPRRAPGSWECSQKFCPFWRKCFMAEVV
jgi:hypothetical protein